MGEFKRVLVCAGSISFIILCFIGLWVIIDFITKLGFEQLSGFVTYFVVTIIAFFCFIMIIASYILEKWQTKIMWSKFPFEKEEKGIDKIIKEEGEKNKIAWSPLFHMIPLIIISTLLLVMSMIIILFAFFSPNDKPLVMYVYPGLVYLLCLYLTYDLIRKNIDIKRIVV